jgi:hypothetical protein
MVEDRGTVEDRLAPVDGKFDLEQPATIATVSIKLPTSRVFDIFAAVIAPLHPLRVLCGAIEFIAASGYRADVSSRCL